VRIVKKFNLPLLVTGGGGYTKENVARCWSVEIAVLLDTELPNEIPVRGHFSLHFPRFPSNCGNGLLLIRKNALATKSDIKRLRFTLASSLEKDVIDQREVEKLEENYLGHGL